MQTLLLNIITVLTYAILGRALISWLFIAGIRNELVVRLDYALGIFTEPLIRPLRRFIPRFGNIDITPLVALLILTLILRPAVIRFF